MIEQTYKKIARVLFVILLLNVGVAVAKIIVGNLMNSSSVMADGFHSLTDGTSNVIGLVGIFLASRPADKSHQYGHKKYETFFAIFISFFLLVVGYNLVVSAYDKFMHLSAPNISNIGIVVMIVTLFVNIFVVKYETSQGKKLNSSILIADAKHTLSDVYVTISVLISIIGIKYFNFPLWIDPMVTLIVAFFIFKAGFEIIKETMSILVDSAILDEQEVKKIILSIDRVEDCHMIRSRGNDNDCYLDLHVLVDPKMSVYDAHNLSHEIDKTVKAKTNLNISTLVHIEPYLPEEIK